MGRACSTCKGEVHSDFWWGNLREGVHLENPGVYGRIILKWFFVNWERDHRLDRSGSVRDWWRAFVYAVINLRVP
jgi:hypothetical protein